MVNDASVEGWHALPAKNIDSQWKKMWTLYTIFDPLIEDIENIAVGNIA